jgi:hypothetical protein
VTDRELPIACDLRFPLTVTHIEPVFIYQSFLHSREHRHCSGNQGLTVKL